MIAVLAAVLLAYLAYKRPPSVVGLLWLCALALSFRCFFESVMDVFYLGPPLVLIVLTAATGTSWRRFLGAWIVAMVATVYCYQRASEWGYWVPMVLLLAIGLGWAWPGRSEVGVFGVIRATEEMPSPHEGRVASVLTAVRWRASSPLSTTVVPRDPSPTGSTGCPPGPPGTC